MPKLTTTTNDTTATAGQIIDGFFALARSRSMVRLEWGNYWTGDRESSLEGYRQDRNTIRRDTRAFQKVSHRIYWVARVNPQRFADALIEASGGSRFDFDPIRKVWNYTTGQYQPVEIRGACVRLLERAERILNRG